jgi:hypothetical protein
MTSPVPPSVLLRSRVGGMKSDLSAGDERREEDGKKFIVNNRSIVCSLSTLQMRASGGQRGVRVEASEEFELALASISTLPRPDALLPIIRVRQSDEIGRSSTRLEVAVSLLLFESFLRTTFILFLISLID